MFQIQYLRTEWQEHYPKPWWGMETFTALLALCEGNSPVTGEFQSQRPVTRCFDIFFDLRLNERLSNNRNAGNLKRHRAHYDVTVMIIQTWHLGDVIWVPWRLLSSATPLFVSLPKLTIKPPNSTLLTLCAGNPLLNSQQQRPVVQKAFPDNDVIMIHTFMTIL